MNPLWLANMIDPFLMDQDPVTGALTHRIHQNQFRPTWIMWFTPPANSRPQWIQLDPITRLLLLVPASQPGQARRC